MREDFYWLNEESIKFLENGYLTENTTPKQRIREIGDTAQKILGIEGFSDKFYNYMAKGYYSLASPIWANFGLDRGLPISCNGSFIDDSMESILGTQAEVGMLTKYGAGTAGYFGQLRGRGEPIKDNGTSFGSVHFMELFDKMISVVSQGSFRRGNFAAYLPIDHKDITEFLNIKTEGHPIQNIFTGVCVPDYWLDEMKGGDKKKRKIWAKVLQSRKETGMPYIFFSDNVNKNKPQVFKDKELEIYTSQLCSEILLPNDKDSTFVCDLSSINLVHIDEIKKTDAVYTLTLLLDAAMSEYIEKTKNIPYLERANKFAREHRSVGVGALGWHSLLQSKMIAFDSYEAMALNADCFRHIQEQTIRASKDMAKILGEPEVMKGYGMRNSALQAIAPTTSSAFILGQVSQSIEPIHSNYYVKDLAKSKTTCKNPYLKEVLASYGKDTKEVWNAIRDKNGSVQDLPFLSKHEKDVFKTFGEISQLTIVQQAAQRQKFIDQGQSLNLMINPDTSTKEVNALILKAHELGVKTLYYQKGVNAAQNFSRSLMDCKVCEA